MPGRCAAEMGPVTRNASSMMKFFLIFLSLQKRWLIFFIDLFYFN